MEHALCKAILLVPIWGWLVAYAWANNHEMMDFGLVMSALIFADIGEGNGSFVSHLNLQGHQDLLNEKWEFLKIIC